MHKIAKKSWLNFVKNSGKWNVRPISTSEKRLDQKQNSTENPIQLPHAADVVIIGGGSAGCNLLYQLAKRGKGENVVLLERDKLTSGTTWHTAGLVWRLRPNDVEIRLLDTTRKTLIELDQQDLNPGWIQNGGLFIAHSETRMDEYRRLHTLGKCFGVDSYLLDPAETIKIFPLLDQNAFTGALYSPGDGVVNPNEMCEALTKVAKANGAQVIENCPVTDILTGENAYGDKHVKGVITPHGMIRTNCVVNAAGVWSNDTIERLKLTIPLIPMKHAYVVTEPIEGIFGMPNVRDHDYSIYFRIQGSSICMGGYEDNPIILDQVDKDFQFSLYDLDMSIFEAHANGAAHICPAFGKAQVPRTVCGPESFTPDHKPLMGPDPRLDGLFHHCGYNSAGMMLGGGCGAQMAEWILHGKPSLHMFAYDIRRFTQKQQTNRQWATEKSHEAYKKNYSIVFPNDQPLAGRNLTLDPFHKELVLCGAVMGEKQGWERPEYYLHEETAPVQSYDWYGAYDKPKNTNTFYEEKLEGDSNFGFSEHHDLIGEEAMTCRTDAIVFNLSYFCKLFLTGADAFKAADWIFTSDLNRGANKVHYTCALNHAGGVESDCTVTSVESGRGALHDPTFKGRGYYIVAGGASANYTLSHINASIKERGFRAKVCDITRKVGVLSIQGPKSRKHLQELTSFDLSNENLPPNYSAMIDFKINARDTVPVRILRVSFVGELGYELHIAKDDCLDVYNALMKRKLRNGGYRALYSLSCEKGYHLWGFDLRTDDTPMEANLGFTCRKNGGFNGYANFLKQSKEGVNKKIAFFTLNEQLPIWGLEAIYRDGERVGHVRRGEYGYTLQKPIGIGYVKHPENKVVTNDFIKNGKYQIEVMGTLYDATCQLRSPFDPKGERILGNYQ